MDSNGFIAVGVLLVLAAALVIKLFGTSELAEAEPKCPVTAEQEAWLLKRWAWIMEAFGTDVARDADIVLARPRFFPDRHDDSLEAQLRLCARVCEYMRVDPSTVELKFFQKDQLLHRELPVGARTTSGAAGLYFKSEDGVHHIRLDVSLVRAPEHLIATLAHELAHVHLIGSGRLTADDRDHEPLTDLLTVYFGMGVFTANAVIREETWQSGNRSGWSVGRSGYLTMPEFAYAHALMARLRDEDQPGWASELRLDVREPFRHALSYLKTKPEPTH